MRVALLRALDDGATLTLAAGLAAAGATPWVITSGRGRPRRTRTDGIEITRSWHPPERRLQRRGFHTPLSHLPGSYLALARGDAELAHAFDLAGAAAVARWSQRTGRPSVFTFPAPPDRAWLVAYRLRLDYTLRAVHHCAALVTETEEAADALEVSLGVRARLISGGGAERYAALYAELLGPQCPRQN